jgi:hypothetical protein
MIGEGASRVLHSDFALASRVVSCTAILLCSEGLSRHKISIHVYHLTFERTKENKGFTLGWLNEIHHSLQNTLG